MKIKNYEASVAQLQAHLSDYLESKGIDTSSLFNCINPNHEDKSPSCSLGGNGIPAGKVFNCYGCGVSGNIFTAKHFLDGAPLTGIEFILENLTPLAEQFGIPLETTELTEEELYEYDTYRAYRTASDLITNGIKSQVFNKTIKERGWNTELCKEFGVGCIHDYKAFRESLKRLGFQASFLDDTDLSRRDVFGEDTLIFTIRDDKGRPVGFAARNLFFQEGGKRPKYVNQKHTGMKCNIYRKSERLFGFDRVLTKRKKKHKTIYIFEGYSDVLTAVGARLEFCVALGGTALTAEHVQLLKQYDFYDIILVLDGDTAGKERTAALLDSTLAGHKDLSVRVINLPDEMDPDEFIRSEGISKFKKLKRWSAFEWRLAQFSSDIDDEVVAKSMIPLIVNEPSFVTQEKQCRALAETTGVSLRAIQSDLSRLQNQREAEKDRERQNIIDRMQLALQRRPEEAEKVLYEAENSLFNLARKYDEDSFSEDSCLAVLDARKTYEECKDGNFPGFVLGPDLQSLQEALCGEWKQDVWLCLAGKPNVGKSSYLVKLAYCIASREVENDAIVIYHSTDDTISQLLPKFVCIADGSRKLTLNEVADPNYYASNITDEHSRQRMLDQREEGYNTIRNLMKKGRLVLKDSNDGESMAYADRIVKYYKSKYPGRNLVYIRDNFHKSPDFKSIADVRVQHKIMSNAMKSLVTRNHICGIASMEYKKIQEGQRGKNSDLLESGQMEYDASFVGHMYNDMHESGSQTALSHVDQVGEKLATLPVIELTIGKNKITAFKDTLHFCFWPSSSDFMAADTALIERKKTESLENLEEVYKEIVHEECENMGRKLGRAAHVFKDRHGIWPPFKWQDEFKEQYN